jgi:hypothetical protein
MAKVLVLRPATLVRRGFFAVGIVHALNALVHLAHGFTPAPRAWWLDLFDVDTEANVPTWFSSGLLLACAFAAWLMAERAADRVAERRGFRLLSALLAIVSADELVALHERIAAALLSRLSALGVAALWVWALGGAIVASLAAVLLPFLRALGPRLRSDLLLSAAVYVAGALGLEVLGQRYAAAHGWFDPVYTALAASEELLEMCGALLFLRAVGRALAGPEGIVSLHVAEDARE